MKTITTVNFDQAGLKRIEYTPRFQFLTSVLYNIRYRTRQLGYDLGLWNDSEILALEDFIDNDEEIKELLDSL